MGLEVNIIRCVFELNILFLREFDDGILWVKFFLLICILCNVYLKKLLEKCKKNFEMIDKVIYNLNF